MSTAIPSFENLTPKARRQLLDKLRRDRAWVTQDYPLSWSQERLWLLEQMVMGHGYIVSAALRLFGRLDVEALRGAHNDITARHEILRATFHDVNGTAVQRVHPVCTPEFEIVDLPGSDPDPIVAEYASRPFDLGKLPLLRANVLRVNAEEHIWIMTAHHIVFDGWSVGVFVRDIAAFYAARLRRQTAPLVPLPMQYPAFARTQRSQNESDRVASHVAWWRNRLAGAAATLELPFDRNRPVRLSEKGAVHFFELGAEESERLRSLCSRAGATLFMGLLAVFSALLSRYGGQTDLVIGTPAANRGGKDREPAIGFFVSTLPLRVDLSGRPCFSELLRRVKDTCVQAFVHQDVPFERIVNELKIARDPSRNPLFQVMFGLRNMDTSFDLEGLRAVPMRIARTTSQFDLTLLMKETPRGIEGAFEYSTDLFDGATIERIGIHFAYLAEGVLAEPAKPISIISFFTPEERAAVAGVPTEWSDPVADFEMAAQRRPDHPAIVWDGGEITYCDLDRNANRVAAELRRRGAGPETLVGLQARRSPGAIAGLLGILKAGAAFLPLDPDYPAERLAFMVGDSGIRLIVSHEPPPETLPRSIEYIRSDQVPDRSFTYSPPDPECQAYAIYTSGSTGRPKGATITRGSLGHFCASAREHYRAGETDRVLQFASLSFDTAIEEILPCLTAGATLVLRNDAMIEEPARLLEACDSHSITILDLPTSWWRRMLAEMVRPGLRLPSSVRTVIIGGEACTREALEQWGSIEHARGVRLLNTYGPTETCVVATFAELSGNAAAGHRDVSIGLPLGAAYAVIADSNLQPVPFGTPGELLIGGPGLARGYIGRAGLTAERFIPDFTGQASGGRLYRTGDLARRRPDGQIEFVGRTDQQVKIRGFRIEPSEIEGALCTFASVTAALAVVDGEILRAFVTTATGVSVQPETLRRFLRGRLPHYMIPGAIHVVGELARLPNGKLDRKHIPVVETAGCAATAEPAGEIEVKLAAIWCSVLRMERISLRDNFFELGGDSIMTIQVTSRAAQQGLPLTSRDVFEHQTIAELAAELQGRIGREIQQSRANENESPGPYPLSPIQRWFFERNYARPAHFNQSVMVEIAAGADIGRLAQALRTVLARHQAFRLRFHAEDGEWKQFLAPRIEPESVEIADRIDLGLQRRLDIEKGPVVRIQLVSGRDGMNGRLFAVAHHLIIDGVSWRVLVEEAATAYSGHLLAPTTEPFTAWPDALLRHTQKTLEARKLQWLEAPAQTFPLPLDHHAAPSANTIASSERLITRLGSHETVVLLKQAFSALNARADELLLAACAGALMRWTQSEGLTIDLESHGRPHLAGEGDYSRTIGWFTSLYPVTLLPGDYDLDQVLRSARRTLRGIPDAGIDYGVLRYLAADSATRAKLAARPGAEIAFNYLGQIDASLMYPFTGVAAESHGDVHDPMEVRSHLIEITALVESGELRMEWNFSRALHLRETIRSLADAAEENLKTLLSKAHPHEMNSLAVNRRMLERFRTSGTRGR